jgi:predicted MFS family arabinose efflux permease
MVEKIDENHGIGWDHGLTRGGFALHYGWVVVCLTFFSILVVAGVRSISGILMLPLEQEFEWSRSGISFAFALNLILYGFSGPFIAAAMERIGIRKIMIWALVLLVAALCIVVNITSIWQFHIVWGIIIALASGVFLTVLSATVANRWFEKRRGMVLGMLMASTAAGQLIFLPFLSGIIELYSWRTAIYIFVGLGILTIPLIAIWMRDRPSDKGLFPYGAANDYIPSPTSKKNPISSAFEGLWIGVRSLPFWLLASSYFVCGASTAGLIGTHFIPASTHHGIPPVQAAGLLAFMGIFNIIGSVFSGWLSDRFDNRWLLFWYYGLRGLTLLFLPYAFELQSYFILIAFIVFYGLDWIATVAPTVRLATDHFGKEQGSIIYGWLFAAHQLGSGAAAFMGGYMYEHYHSYTITFLSAGILCILATVFVFSVKQKQQAVTA